MTNGFGIDKKEKEQDFYERNYGKSVNLYTGKDATISGEIKFYDREKGIVKLTKYIIRRYNEDGTSKFVEAPDEFEFDTVLINVRETTTREDRLGRIAIYNKDLQIEEREKNKKLSGLEYPIKNSSK